MNMLLPVVYFAIVPTAVRRTIQAYDFKTFVIKDSWINSQTNETVQLFISGTETGSNGWPLFGSIFPVQVELFEDSWSTDSFGSIKLSHAIPFSYFTSTDVQTTATLAITDPDAMQRILSCTRCTRSVGSRIEFRTKITIKLWGFTWYKALPIVFQKNTFQKKPESVLESMKIVPKAFLKPHPNEKLHAKYSVNDSSILTFENGFPDIYVNHMNVSRVAFNKLDMILNLELVNPLNIAFNVTKLGFSLGFNGRNFVKFSLIPLQTDFIEFKLDGIMHFNAMLHMEVLDRQLMMKTPIFIFLQLMSELKSSSVTIDGPFSLVSTSGSDFLGTITNDLVTPIILNATSPNNDVMTFLERNNITADNFLLDK